VIFVLVVLVYTDVSPAGVASDVDPKIVTPRTPLLCIDFATVCYNVAAASTAPAALNAVLFVMTTSTGYFHSMNFAQPVRT
jgi:hypothetical protein